MKKVKVAYYWEESDGERVFEEGQGFMLTDTMALMVDYDLQLVHMENIEPSTEYPGYYENDDNSPGYIEFPIKSTPDFAKMDGMTALNLLSKGAV
ncbi:hypothetical protein [Evansella halocellulosilytica]|uniref:hypothetical protein n=1 Tax=Evansella halocellulosilytica TaxID=2011013 RepID=UPI000BB85A89|nr:hypothetical protein [Evansella halocellulosilytica]